MERETAAFMKQRVLFGLAVATASLTVVLILAGALVVKTGSGLSVPDWPLSFGQFFPPMEGGVVYEHTHRMIAASVGFLTVVLSVALWRSPLPRAVKILGSVAVLLVIIQGIFGGITVLFYLPLNVNIVHASLAQTFFSVLVCLAALIKEGTSPSAPSPNAATSSLRRWGTAVTALIFLQLLVGAYLRHSGGGLHAHMTLAGLVAVGVVFLTLKILRRTGRGSELSRPGHWLSVLMSLQVVLGLSAWARGGLWLTTTHTAVGALLLACSALVTMQTYRKLRPVV